MSRKEKTNLICEKCGKEFFAERYDSINVTLDPELRKKFLSNELYLFKCPHCGNVHYKPYPVLYHDMEHKFMVQGGTYKDIFGFVESLAIKNDFEDMIKNITAGYIYTGALTPVSAIEKVIALENNLDHRLATMYRTLVATQYDEYAKKNKKPLSHNAYLYYDDNGKLITCIEIRNQETKKEQCIYQPFDRKLYNQIEHDFLNYLDDMCDYLFTTESAINIFSSDLSNKGTYKVNQYALIDTYNGESFFALIPPFNTNIYKENDEVVVYDYAHISKGKIARICEYSMLSAPFDADFNTVYKVLNKPIKEIEHIDDYDEIDNNGLLEGLINSIDNNKEIPYELIKESDVYIGLISNGMDVFYDHVVTAKDENSFRLMCVYLNKDNTKKMDYKDSEIKLVSFDELIKYVVSNPEKYDGIIVNPNNDDIEMSSNILLDKYFAGKTITNDKRLIKLLEKLSDKEIDYLGELNYKIISMVYFENKNPKTISEELNLPINKIGEELTNTFRRLKDIIKTNYS